MVEKNSGDKRLQIIQSAEYLIAQSGFQGLSMQKLAKDAGVAAGTIYRYFDDKEHLLVELRLHVAQRIAKAIQANVSDDMPLKLRYRTMWLNIWSLASSNSTTIRNRAQYDSLPSSETRNSREAERQFFAQVDRMFDEGKAQGLFRPMANELLFTLSLEVSVTLARKHSLGIYQLDEAEIESAIEASWDAIIQN